jgi:hypothetical protein
MTTHSPVALRPKLPTITLIWAPDFDWRVKEPLEGLIQNLRESAGGGSEAAREINECGYLFIFPLAVDCAGSGVVDRRGVADLWAQAVRAENQ